MPKGVKPADGGDFERFERATVEGVATTRFYDAQGRIEWMETKSKETRSFAKYRSDGTVATFVTETLDDVGDPIERVVTENDVKGEPARIVRETREGGGFWVRAIVKESDAAPHGRGGGRR